MLIVKNLNRDFVILFVMSRNSKIDNVPKVIRA